MKKSVYAVSLVVFLVLALAMPALAAIHYFQGFETDTYDWTGVTRVASGTNGVASAAGDYHGEAASGAFSRFGGYESTFPGGGYTTSVDVYLNVGASNANDTRFDWSSAINSPAGTHRRDFVFNVGFYTDSDVTGSVPRFVISGSNNAFRSSAFPKNPQRSPIAITTTGWYTFEHQFQNNSGILKVVLRVSTLNGVELGTWPLTDPSDTINGISGTVGGHRYGWFAFSEFPLLAIDNVSLLSLNLVDSVSACKNDGWLQLTRADGSPFNNQGDCIQYVNTGR